MGTTEQRHTSLSLSLRREREISSTVAGDLLSAKTASTVSITVRSTPSRTHPLPVLAARLCCLASLWSADVCLGRLFACGVHHGINGQRLLPAAGRQYYRRQAGRHTYWAPMVGPPPVVRGPGLKFEVMSWVFEIIFISEYNTLLMIIFQDPWTVLEQDLEIWQLLLVFLCFVLALGRLVEKEKKWSHELLLGVYSIKILITTLRLT